MKPKKTKKNKALRTVWLILILVFVIALLAAMAVNDANAGPGRWWLCWFYKCWKPTPIVDYAATARAGWGCKCDPYTPGDCEGCW